MNKIVKYFKESYDEMRKVVWPGKDEVQASTKVVLASLVIFTIVLGTFDFGIAAIVDLLF